MDDLSGQLVEGRYRLERLLGEGAMGSVYLGVQLAVERRVAIKLLHKFLQARQDFRERFELEAKALGRLSHPNCLTIFDFGFDAKLESFYMVVEYVEGKDLAERMHEPMPLQVAATVGLQIAEALSHAHAQGILHRDLKPENVMLTGTQGTTVKVLDFGLAKLFDVGPSDDNTKRRRQLTKAGEIFGTPAYMSPEQCQGSRTLTQTVDIYALGVMLFEMVEGYLPFHAKTPPEVMLMQMKSPVPDMRADLPADFVALVNEMLAKSPAERTQTAAEVAQRLAGYASGTPGATRSVEIPVAQVPQAAPGAADTTAQHKLPMNLPPLLIAAAVVVLILAAAGTWFMIGLATDAPPPIPAPVESPP